MQLIVTAVVVAALMLVEGQVAPLFVVMTALACTFSKVLNKAVPLAIPVVVG